jgi:small GTP-binding protein
MKSGFVALLGRPNAGKSTLLNRILGQKLAIVSDKPQTTRTRVAGVKNYAEAQVVFVDTPGVHKPTHRMNVRMVDTAIEAMREVDVVCLVVDASVKPGPGDRHLLTLLKDVKVPVILALNKVDIVSKPKLLPLLDQYSKAHPFAELVPLSAVDGTNVDTLEGLMPALSAGRGAALSAGLLHRSERALLCIGDRPRAGAAADARRAAVFNGRGRRQVRRSRIRTDQAVLHDPRRTRVAEADRRRESGLDDQGDRHRCASRTGRALPTEGVPRSARQSEIRMAR